MPLGRRPLAGPAPRVAGPRWPDLSISPARRLVQEQGCPVEPDLRSLVARATTERHIDVSAGVILRAARAEAGG